MSFLTYASGVVGLTIIVGAWGIAGRSVARSLMPSWPVPIRALAAVTVALSGALVTAQVIGTFGLFRRGVLVVASLIGALIVNNVARRQAASGTSVAAPSVVSWRRLSGPAKLAVVATCLVVGQWTGASLGAYQHGFSDPDSQHYHLSHAARFVQDNRTSSLHFTSVDDGSTYHPANTELLHAIGVLEMRSEVVSTVLNLALLPLALLAAYCLGRRFNAGPAALIGMVAFTALPGGKAYAATAGNDYAGIGFFLAACAFALHADDDEDARAPAYLFAGLAAGLALGTKLTMVVPVVGLVLTLLWILRRRMGSFVWFALPAVLTGSYWYIRNLVHVGSPVPTLHLGIFPSPPMKTIEEQGYAVSDYITNSHFLRHEVPPAMKGFLGVGWPLTMVFAGVGLLLALLATRRVEAKLRPLLVGLALSGGAVLAAYLVTPTTAGGPKGDPFLFVYNVRYMLPGLVLGAVLLPTVPVLRHRQREIAAVGVALIVIALLSPTRISTGAIVLAVVLFAMAYFAMRLGFRGSVTVVAASAVVLAGIGFPLARRYEHNRYSNKSNPRVALLRFGNQLPKGAHVAIVGFPLQFAFNGPRLQARADYLGEHRSNHEFTDYSSCTAWRAALRDGGFDYVVAERPSRGGSLPPAAAWTATDPSARIVLETTAGTIYELSGAADPSRC